MPLPPARVLAGEAVRWYVTRARHPLKGLVVARAWAWLASHRLWVRYDGDACIGVRLDDYLQQRIFLDGAYERPLLAWLEGVLTADDVFWDVGANIGAVTIVAARRCRQVVAFEPDPRTLPVLAANLRANALGNVDVVAQALGAESGAATLYQAASSNSGMTSLVAGRAEGADEARVPVVRGDELVRARPERGPTVMKIDVEGAEHLVLGGLTGVLASGQVRAIVFEDARTDAGEPANSAVVSLLRDAGYTIGPFAHSDEQADHRMFNFLATRGR